MSAAPLGVVTLPVVRALLDEARKGNYLSGVVGIRARPTWAGAGDFEHAGVPVEVVPCVSALAVREALLRRAADRWVVVVTDRDDADLGAGLRSHFVWHRLRTPDPWDAVLGKFAATGLDPALTAVPGHRDLAAALLACTPVEGGWPPAPGGVLTRDHALAAVAERHLQLVPDSPRDLLSWTAQPPATALVADLRSLAGDALTDAVLEWAARRVGAAGPQLLGLLRRGQGRQAVPYGVVLGALAPALTSLQSADVTTAQVATALLGDRAGAEPPTPAACTSWSVEATGLVSGWLRDTSAAPLALRLLDEADSLLGQVHAATLAESSALLPGGLTARLGRLAAALRTSAGPGETVELPAVPDQALSLVELAWTAVDAHLLAGIDSRVDAFRAAVRLTRWLSLDSSPARLDLPGLQRRHLDTDAWVDSAVNDAWSGADDPELGAALAAVLAAARRRRDRHDADYAAALAVQLRDEAPADPACFPVEDLLATAVLPLARRTPVLLLVLDGMSASVGLEIVDSVVAAEGWVEALPAGSTRRDGAVAVLPSITRLSRASLLSGELCAGEQVVEQRGYAALTRAYGLDGAALFHKKQLDSTAPGFPVAHDVGTAIDDQDGRRLVTCVLNTIDDALHRADPAGTVWTDEAVKHLRPLLARARLAGRAVVLTSDHGHIVERREGTQRNDPGRSSNRSRAATAAGGDELGVDEVLVAGRRVLEHGGRAVLAVDERLRYGPLEAGYHGGAAPAEVVVPIYYLLPGADGTDGSLVPCPPQAPSWWLGPVSSSPPPIALVATPTLFDPEPLAAEPLAARLLACVTYTEQRALAGRVSVTDAQLSALLSALLGATGHRLPPLAAALALGVAPTGLRGAVLHAQRLLNVEGYAVVSFDADGVTVVLDEALLREQFGL